LASAKNSDQWGEAGGWGREYVTIETSVQFFGKTNKRKNPDKKISGCKRNKSRGQKPRGTQAQ